MAQPMLNLGGNLSPEQQIEQQQIARQQRMAELLMQQSQQTPQGQMVSGRYVAPNFFQYAAPLLQGYLGKKELGKVEDRQLDMAKRLREQGVQETQRLMNLIGGRPATPEQVTEMAGPYTDNVPMPTAYMAAQPAIEVNPRLAYAEALNMQSPQAKALLPQIAAEAFKKPEAFTLTKGAKRFVTMPDGTSKEVASGAEDLPDSIQYAITVGQLPSNPKTWTPQQAALAKSIVESKTSAGANKFDFSNMLGKSVSDVAPILIASKTATSGAIQQADAANRIIQSLDTNKIFTGAGANQKLQIAQIGQMLGITGGKTEEIVANTRTAIQSLAQLTLQGRKQMRGEGAITESEGALAQRAISGDINLTAGELRILANAAKRSAKFTYDQHQSMMGALAKDSPNSVPYYQLEVNPSIFGESTTDVRKKADAILDKK
jgi:hypothetical protein